MRDIYISLSGNKIGATGLASYYKSLYSLVNGGYPSIKKHDQKSVQCKRIYSYLLRRSFAQAPRNYIYSLFALAYDVFQGMQEAKRLSKIEGKKCVVFNDVFTLIWASKELRSIGIVVHHDSGDASTYFLNGYKVLRLLGSSYIIKQLTRLYEDCHLNIFLSKSALSNYMKKYQYGTSIYKEIYSTGGRANFKGDISANVLKIVMLGTVSHRKGHDRLKLFVNKLRENDVKFTIDIWGQGNDGLIPESNCIEYKGLLDPNEVRRVLASYDILLSLSRDEGLPLSILEGVAMGLLPVATEVGAVGEIYGPHTKFLVPEKCSINDLERIAINLKNKNLINSELNHIQNRYLDLFSEDKFKDEWIHTFNSIKP